MKKKDFLEKMGVALDTAQEHETDALTACSQLVAEDGTLDPAMAAIALGECVLAINKLRLLFDLFHIFLRGE